MGLILDTSILISAERRGGGIRDVVSGARPEHGNADIGISAISVVELTHGIYRAENETRRERRRVFVQQALDALMVYPATFEIAQLAGRIEGEQAARGFSIPFQDLLIGCTALYLGFDVATTNVRHFKLIPGLKMVAL